ncbi:peptide cleavage/export ABC transporter [Lactobacillus buchneri]|uniref:peptide cleavage/export ABC transporter n=1 Tax=Lentilactobacillus buchneri TaxID=1581 RepID=UPI001291DEEF|nr:peptide cleavage/export ABC transporter [Lentilactobacillus buchneri]MQM81693.1 peptide cleavage/export ABC transporter [Lentilactobacillus buchneri]
MMWNHYYVSQLDETDCGAAALAMILKYYGSRVSISTIRKYAQTDKNGTTALGLIHAATHFNLAPKAIKTNISFLKGNIPDIPIPFIAHVNKKYGQHYVVVCKLSKSTVTIADPDPSIKTVRMSYNSFGKDWTGISLHMTPTDKYTVIKEDTNDLRSTSKLLFRQKGIIASVLLATMLSTLITISGAFFLKQIIDSMVKKGQADVLCATALSLLLTYIFHGFFTYTQEYLSMVLGQRVSLEILLKYIRHLFKLPMAFFEERKIGEITSRFSDAETIISTLSRTVVITILDSGVIIITGIVLSCINMRLFILSAIGIPAYIIIMLIFYKPFHKYNYNRMEKNSDLNSQLIEDLRGMESIKSLNAEDKMYETLDKKFVNTLRADHQYNVAVILQESLKSTTGLILSLLVLYSGAKMAINGQITVGQLVAFNSLMGYFIGPFESIINLQNNLQHAGTASSRLNQILHIPIDQQTNQSIRNSENKDQSTLNFIQYSNVSFEYKYGQPILKQINLTINRNESTAIIGSSGSGKTTLLKLLIKFYLPSTGTIMINDYSTTTAPTSELRKYIAYNPQTPYIFSGSVLDNILLGTKNDKTLAQVKKAAQLAEIDEEIKRLPKGYLTILSEDTGLSGGQMQRLAIARAIISDAKVLVFDESTSNLDVLTEKKILTNLRSLPNKTIVYIAHRLEVAQAADRIIVMDNGTIVESGTHSQLLRNRNKYYNLIKEK